MRLEFLILPTRLLRFREVPSNNSIFEIRASSKIREEDRSYRRRENIREPEKKKHA